MQDDKTPGSQQSVPETPSPEWEYREEFRVNSHMKQVIGLTRKVVEGEIDRLRRQLDRLTYGS